MVDGMAMMGMMVTITTDKTVDMIAKIVVDSSTMDWIATIKSAIL